ncbi:phospholipase effector Tle1 domain-containing protein [Candidatus Thiodiazotropha sp. LNASS1]|uniref:phospholipase effector Tle1 domain-containing protein n=1 Tax=Candidatus Thiodiazotropha sp. LNASS1 TaxID=3096260 RepID=UPI0034DFA40D
MNDRSKKDNYSFISYSRHDQDFARRLAGDLSERAHHVFFDQTSIPAGEDWTRSIQTALESCSRLILILSPHAVESKNVLDETRYALDHGKSIFLVLYHDCSLPFWLWRIEYVDFQSSYDKAFTKLYAELSNQPRTAVLPTKMESAAMETPRQASSRNLVVCFDFQQFPTFELNSNAYYLTRMAYSASERQIVYYDPGVQMRGGTDFLSALRQNLRAGLRVWTRHDIAEHVEYAYKFLMDNYREGDRLFLFGSSAGGPMAIALAEILETFGLLDKAGTIVVPYAIHGMGRVTDSEAQEFKSSLSRECPPYFIGMWDCVRVIGAFSRRRNNPQLSEKTVFGYHALAIDETRKFFQPVLWDNTTAQGQTLEQTWFAGVHADISGGYRERGLSDIPLQWMLDKANAAGMLIDQEQYQRLQPDPLSKMHNSRVGPLRFFPSHPRKITKGAMLHPSVEKRIQQSDYSPGNLKKI